MRSIVRDRLATRWSGSRSGLTPSGRRSRVELTPHARGPATLSIQRWWRRQQQRRRPRGMKPSTREISPPFLPPSACPLTPFPRGGCSHPTAPGATLLSCSSSTAALLSSVNLRCFSAWHSTLPLRAEFVLSSTEFDLTLHFVSPARRGSY